MEWKHKAKKRRFQVVSISALLIGLFFLVQPVAAAVNTSWQRATPIKSSDASQVLYGELRQAGSSAFFRLPVKQSGTVELTLSVPIWADQEFVPQLVLYQPDEMTFGPILPMAQPPETLALIFPSAENKSVVDQSSVIEHRVVQKTTWEFSKPGQYYFAVYNVGTSGGRWRLSFTGTTHFSDLLQWPGQWWSDQAWAGLSWRTIFVPGWILGLAVGAILLLEKIFRSQPIHHKRK